jgi:uncharacterized protein
MDNLLHFPSTFFILLLIGFAAGFLDSIVGGGGLISTPALMNVYPTWSTLSIIGTNRTSSIFGTSVAAWNYFQKVKIARRIVIPACVGALTASFFGAQLAKKIPTDQLKLVVLVLIVILAFYTVFKKELGQTENRRFTEKQEPWVAFFIATTCGFYNGLIGPGTGTMLVFGFVSIFGFDFLKSSAISKVCNVSGDLSSWLVFLFGGLIVLKAAIPLVIANIIGSFMGSKLAILKGSKFIRWVFLAVVLGLIVRFLTQS